MEWNKFMNIETDGSKNKAVYKRFIPSWRVSGANLASEKDRSKFYLGYFVESVRTANPFLGEYVRRKVPNTTEWWNSQKAGVKIRRGIPTTTGEFFKDGTVAFTNEGGKHEDLAEGEGQSRDDMLALFQVFKGDREDEIQVGIWTPSVELVHDLLEYIFGSKFPDKAEFSIEVVDDLFHPYESAQEYYMGTLEDYRKSFKV